MYNLSDNNFKLLISFLFEIVILRLRKSLEEFLEQLRRYVILKV